ncbi:MAG: AbrB/MazE/SpoVT family DNA-binding domain-containing protein [Candidatus Methanoperedens sp.]
MPKEIADALSIQEGTELNFSVQDKKIIISKAIFPISFSIPSPIKTTCAKNRNPGQKKWQNSALFVFSSLQPLNLIPILNAVTVM